MRKNTIWPKELSYTLLKAFMGGETDHSLIRALLDNFWAWFEPRNVDLTNPYWPVKLETRRPGSTPSFLSLRLSWLAPWESRIAPCGSSLGSICQLQGLEIDVNTLQMHRSNQEEAIDPFLSILWRRISTEASFLYAMLLFSWFLAIKALVSFLWCKILQKQQALHLTVILCWLKQFVL